MLFRYAPILIILLLSGCFVTNRIITKLELGESISASELWTLADTVEVQAKQMGGECERYKSGLNCRFLASSSSRYTEVNVGVARASGLLYISIDSEVVTVFSKTDAELEAGEILPEFHKEWEERLVSNFPDEVTSVRIRKYSAGRDIVQHF